MSNICDDLRAAILQAAMQGKLTKQLPEDGNAEGLLKEIRTEKEKAIKNSLVKRQKNIEPLTSTPFDIPRSWCWVQLCDLAYIYSGLTYNKKDLDEKIVDEVTVFRGGNISNMSYCFKADDVKIDKKFIAKDELFLRRNQLITPAVTSQSNLGKIARIDSDYANVVAGGFVLNIVPYIINDDAFSKLLCYFLSSPFYKERCNAIANKSGQAFYNLNRTKLQESAFPLPPLAEQKRIVEKVDELMARVADLEKSADALASLKKSFPGDIKASLLQYAMQGKLTEQLPEDGDAKDLLRCALAEKERGGKNIKKLNVVSNDEELFDIPENWCWIKLPEISESMLGKTLNKSTDFGIEKPYLCSINVYWDCISLEKIKTAKFSNNDISQYRLNKNDLLICEGGDVGRAAVWDKDEEMYYQNALHRVRFYANINVYYFRYLVECYKRNSMIDEYSKGVTIKHLVQNALSSIPFPLPPLAEQKRIVERLDSFVQNINTVGELIASE